MLRSIEVDCFEKGGVVFKTTRLSNVSEPCKNAIRYLSNMQVALALGNKPQDTTVRVELEKPQRSYTLTAGQLH